jgi:ribokinase
MQGSLEQGLERVKVDCVVVTLGNRGCCARDRSGLIRQDAFAVEPVDTTAAGDAFCGVLVASLSQGLGLPQALRRANAAGALTCTQPGAQSSIPTHAQLQAFLRGQPE